MNQIKYIKKKMNLSKADMVKIRQELEEKTEKDFKKFDEMKRHYCNKVFD